MHNCFKLISIFVILTQLAVSVQSAGTPRIFNKVSPFKSIREIEEKALNVFLKQFSFRIEDVPDKIVGGVEAKEGEAPFQAQLFRRVTSWLPWVKPKTSFLCGGSLVSPKTILTAGHCVGKFNYVLRYGSNSRLKSPYPDALVKDIKLHPQFNINTIQNDIALFTLKEAIQPGSNVRAIDLQTSQLAENTTMTLFGFGLTNGIGSPAKNLQKAQLQLLSEKECKEFISWLGLEKTEGMICTQSSGKSACNGDSGGPLVVSETGLQAGVVSFGTRLCPRGSVNVYTNVSNYIDWINTNIEK